MENQINSAFIFAGPEFVSVRWSSRRPAVGFGVICKP